MNATNQAKRNEIANEHASLSQSSCSQEELAAGSKRLKERLVALAGSQRELLARLSHQKEITSLLNKLTEEDNTVHSTASSELASMSSQSTTRRPNVPADRQYMNETSHLTGLGLLPQAQSHSVLALAQQRPQSDLAEPVPLDTLIQHGFLQPENGCLSCTLMVCYTNIKID